MYFNENNFIKANAITFNFSCNFNSLLNWNLNLNKKIH